MSDASLLSGIPGLSFDSTVLVFLPCSLALSVFIVPLTVLSLELSLSPQKTFSRGNFEGTNVLTNLSMKFVYAGNVLYLGMD